MIAALLLLSCGAGGLAASSSADFGAFVSVAPSAASAALPTPSQLVQEKALRQTAAEAAEQPDAKSSENSSVMPSSNVTTNATGKCAAGRPAEETTQCMMDDMVGFVRGPLLPEPCFMHVGPTHPVQERNQERKESKSPCQTL